MSLRFIVFFFSILLSTSFTACAKNDVMNLEAEDVQFFKVSAYDSGDLLMLHVSGLAFHSALVVNALEEIKENDSLHLLISLAPAKKGLSGSFDYTIEVPHEINFVTFGDKRKVIWERKR